MCVFAPRRRVAPRAIWPACVAVLTLLPLAGIAAPNPLERGRIQVVSVAVSASYQTTHALYASGGRSDCSRDCDRLFRSPDGGASWQRMPATGWSARPVVSVDDGGSEILAAPAAKGIELSMDGGKTFRRVRAPTGVLSASPPGSAARVLISTRDAQYMLDARTRHVRPIEGTRLDQGVVVFSGLTGSNPPAFAFGRDPATSVWSVERCDGNLRCGDRAAVGEDALVGVFASPSFARDRTLFAMGLKGLSRSVDGGRTFAPVSLPAPSDSLVNAPQAMAFTPDFDAAAGRGAALLAVISAVQLEKGATTSGGVLASSDGGVHWKKLGGRSLLDHGARSLAVAPDGRVVAAYILPTPEGLAGGVLCARSLSAQWRPSCPAYAATSSTAARATGGSAGTAGSHATGRPAAEQAGAVQSAEPASTVRSEGPGPVTGVAVALPVLAVVLGLLAKRRRALRGTPDEAPEFLDPHARSARGAGGAGGPTRRPRAG